MKYIKKLLTLLSILSISFILSSCKSDEYKEPLDFHTDKQAEYLSGSYLLFSKYAMGKEELSYQKGITIEWSEKTIKKSGSYTFILKETNNLTNIKEYTVKEPKVVLYNLYLNTTYEYQIKTDKEESKLMYFTTVSNGPRNLYIEGTTNSRDLGGYKVNDSYTNQGLIYRTSKLNEDESSLSLLTEETKDIFLNELGIKTEIDLRRTDNNENGGITESPLGNSVKYISIPMNSSGKILTLNQNQIKEVFKVLGDEANYPLIFHCSIGTDRTGLIAFLINALLGVDEDSLYKDYLFSNFGNIGSMRTKGDIDDYIKAIDSSSGSSLKEKTYNYLTSIGVESKDLDNLINIMTR